METHLFLGEVWRDDKGNVLVPLNHAPGRKERLHFDKKAPGMDADVMARFWIDRKIRGQKSAPKSIAPARNLAEVIRIDGKLLGEPGYKLAMALRPSP